MRAQPHGTRSAFGQGRCASLLFRLTAAGGCSEQAAYLQTFQRTKRRRHVGVSAFSPHTRGGDPRQQRVVRGGVGNWGELRGGGAAKKMMHDMRSHSSEASVFPIHRGFKISGHVDDAIQSRPHSASVCRASSTPIPPHLGSACRRVRAEGNLSRTFSGNLHFMSSGDSQTSGSESYTPPSSLAGEPHDASDTQRRARRFTSVEDTTTETAIGVSSAIEIPNVRRKRQTD